MTKFILFFLITIIFAIQKTNAGEIAENFFSTRAMGMGNAFSTVVDDHTALWFNPAALDKIRGMHLTVLNLQLGTDALDVISVYNANKDKTIPQIVSALTGRQIMINLSDTLAYSMRSFAIATYDNLNINANIRNPAYIDTNLTIANDFGFIGGVGFSFIPNILRFGVVGKRITRYGGTIPITPGTLVSLNNFSAATLLGSIGAGWGIDAGLLLELPTPIKPTFSVVWQDMGQTKFTELNSSSSLITRPPIDNNVIFGFGTTFEIALTKIRSAVEFRHYSQWDEQIGKKLHAGVEFEFPGFAVRGGTNQGYLSYGASLNLSYFQVDFASYGVEVGSYPGQTEDRRYFATITIDLNMDPHFDFGSAGTARRPRAFQRR